MNRFIGEGENARRHDLIGAARINGNYRVCSRKYFVSIVVPLIL